MSSSVGVKGHASSLTLSDLEAAPSGLRLAPAHWAPLGLLLGLLDQGAEPPAALVQVLVHQDAVQQVPVFDLQQPGRVLQLPEVVLLQAEKTQLTTVDAVWRPVLLSNRLFSDSSSSELRLH